MQRNVRLSDAEEALVVEQVLAMYRELRRAAQEAPDGKVITVAEQLAVQRGQELTRRVLETVLNQQAAEEEKKGRRAGAARAGDRGGIGAGGRVG